MGTDIHAVIQAKDKHGNWMAVPSEWEENRDYFLFAWLAGVRNGYGFAGVRTFSPLAPISVPRGIPADFEMQDEHCVLNLEAIGPRRRKWYKDDAKDGQIEYWLGDHSHSWLMFDEILEAKKPVTTQTGVITVAQFQKWDQKSPPEEYSRGIWGHDIVVGFPYEVDKKTTHVKVTWEENGSRLDYFIDEVKRLRSLHGNGRIIFGFDS